MVIARQTRLHQQSGHGHPHRQLNGVQDKDAKVQAQQSGQSQDLAQTAPRLVFMLQGLGWNPPNHDHDANKRQAAGHDKQAWEPGVSHQQGSSDQRQGKHHPDTEIAISYK